MREIRTARLPLRPLIMREILIPILTGLFGALAGILAAFVTLRGKRIDESSQIRGELWKEIGSLREMTAQLTKDVATWREKFLDMRDEKGRTDLTVQKLTDDIDEAIDFIRLICSAGDAVDAHDYVRAREILQDLECHKIKGAAK